MKQNILILLSCIFFFSCEKDIDETTVTKIIPPSQELSTQYVIKGQVVDIYGVVIQNAVLSLYLDHEFVDSYFTDSEGRYIIELDDDPTDKLVLVEASYEEGNVPGSIYNRYVRTARFNQMQAVLNYMLTNGAWEEFSNGDPLDRELISFYGQIVDNNGKGGFGALTVFLIGGGSQSQFGEYADLDGNFESFVYPGTLYNIQYYTNCEAEMGIFFFDPENHAYFASQDLTFEEETNLGEFVVNSEFQDYSITATVLDCNGNPVVDGEIDLSQDFLPSSIPFKNGEVKFQRSSCLEQFNSYTISVSNLMTGESSQLQEVSFENGVLDLGEISACQ